MYEMEESVATDSSCMIMYVNVVAASSYSSTYGYYIEKYSATSFPR
jgi:hypothetical protein